ncbi:galactose mutarotase-like domain-containing protein [Gamsiella multidivaricata]|uniref:galactose mutarotase-like domain-containing protein n=1 Tax=Gamsiella multidivaricata TaxID=101098 RepID=UPI00221ECD0B|nr:galactose mutarotase-like domain-containing protein [Gamsiella multidivaricata]KAG0360959.1 hypothetical protein BGZ54_009309 [Gamsiella multidivaricata]KAI7817208.1 galactose mutarotase-like domain-containing protein [Gamsiella multidivaricata]
MPVKTITLSTDPDLVQQHTLSTALDTSARVLSATILTYGATLTHLTFPDRWNQPQDLVLGFDHWQDYPAQAQPRALNPYFGAAIGRTASRIAYASFELESKHASASAGASAGAVSKDPSATHAHTLNVSNGLDCLHGGPLGFDKQHWTTVDTDQENISATLQLVSPHGQSGYPGRLVTRVKYQLTQQGELVVEYWAQLEEDPEKHSVNDLHSTIVSLTNHTYWNLDGVLNPPGDQDQDQGILSNILTMDESPVVHNHCSIKDHTLWLSSSKLVELGDPHPVPTGNILDLSADTPVSVQGYRDLLNFTSATGAGKELGPGLNHIPGGYGYDHVYALDPSPSSSAPASVSNIGIHGYFPSTPHVATLVSPRTGIRLDLSTSEPALILYTAGYLDNKLLPRTKSRPLDLPTSAFFISPTSSPLQSDPEPRNTSQQKILTIKADMDKFAGICLEPIRYPDAIHHREWANMVILHHDQVYRQRSVYKFGVEH